MVQTLSAEAGIDLAEHMDKQEWEAFQKSGVAKARAAIHRRTRETSHQVKNEMPDCPLTDDNVIIKVGNPVREILVAAEEGAFDLIIMDTHGHGKIEEKVIGSTASDVNRQSRCPVLVVQLPQEKTFSANPTPPQAAETVSAAS